MAYFIFSKNLNNINLTLYKIAEDQSYLNKMNINKDDYKIIEVSQEDFNDVKLELKLPLKYDGDNIIYENIINTFLKKDLELHIKNYVNLINSFIENNPNHELFNLWNNYNNQVKSFNLDTLTYPFNKSLIQHFNDLNQPSLSPLQLP
jgi:hypothetical protein